MSSLKDEICSSWSQIKDKTGINQYVLIASVVGVVASLLYFGNLEKEITTLTGIIFPAYMSMKALDSKDEEDDKQWCTYWVVFFSFELVECYFELFSFGALHSLIPYYFLIKLVFLIWLFFPTTQGANFIYEKIFSKVFSKYEVNIDKAINDVTTTFSANTKK